MGRLVLSRKVGQRVRIGKNIWVEVLEIDRNQIRLGFEGPLDVPIFREELLTPEQRKEGKPE